jgi:electron transport complex protein RnfG
MITAVSAGVLAFVSQKTEEPIANALREEKMRAVRNVLPPYDNDLLKDRVFVPDSGGDTLEVFVGKSGGRISGVAFPVITPEGYSGDIHFLVGVNSSGVVQGIEILRHAETPGLGAKIETEEFRAQFRKCSADSPKVWEVKKDGGGFQQITGATISSRAVTRATLKGLRFFGDNFDDIKKKAKAAGAKEEGKGKGMP